MLSLRRWLTIGVLQAISRAEFRYQPTKEIAEVASWRIVDDEPELGYVAFEMPLGPQRNVRCRLAIEIQESGRSVRAFVPLFHFEEYDSQREPFDQAFRSLFEHLAEFFGHRCKKESTRKGIGQIGRIPSPGGHLAILHWSWCKMNLISSLAWM